MRYLAVISLFLSGCVFSGDKPSQKILIPFPEDGTTFRWFNIQSNNGSIKKEYGSYWDKIEVQKEEKGIYEITYQETFGDSLFPSRSFRLNAIIGKIENDSINDFHPLMRISDFPNGYLSEPLDGEISLLDYVPDSDKMEVGYGKSFEMNGSNYDSVVIMVIPPKSAQDENGFVYIFESKRRQLLQEYTVSPNRNIIQGWEVQN